MLWRWVALGSGFCGVLRAVGHSFPYPQRLFRRERLGDEKKVLRRTALPENGNGHQVSLPAAPAFIEQRLGWCLRDRDLYIGLQSLEFPTFPAAAQNTVMADPHKPFWQNVQGEPSRKLLVAEGHFLFFAALSVI